MNIPLLSLRAFVEVGRYGSIKAAASALNVTSGAVSQQIRQLESRLDIALFEREPQGMRLTQAGQELYPKIFTAFEQIDLALATHFSPKKQKKLTISTMPSFAATWLMPRLHNFNQAYPDIEIDIEATSKLVDLKRDHVDIALRHGLGHYPGLSSVKLMAPVLLPVISPKLMGRFGPIVNPEDCLRYPLIQDAMRADWSLWFEAHNITSDPRITRGDSFDDDYLLIRAVEEGRGIALIEDIYVVDALAAGTLVVALDMPWPSEFAYYALTLETADRPEIEVFIRWIVQQATQFT